MNNISPKVFAATTAAAVATIVGVLLQSFVPKFTPEQDVLLVGSLTTILTAVAGYMVPDPARQVS